MFKRKNKCTDKTRKMLHTEKTRVMNETLGYLKEIRKTLSLKVA